MQIWMTIPILSWLGIMSWFDLKNREIPHSAWVIVPLIGALIYRAIIGGWQLAALAVLIALVSERTRLAELTHLPLKNWGIWIPPLVLLIYWGVSFNPIGALAILGFWIAWELHCWGGADAVASMALALVWPDLKFVVALLAIHALVAGTASVFSLFREHKLRVHQLPGLPLLFFSILLRMIIQG